MADQWNGGQSGPGERWNVNLPAVIGVVFVFLVAVIVWVIAASGNDGEASPGSSVPTVSTTTIPPTTVVPTTTPPPMPSTSVVVVTQPAATTIVPATAAPTAAPTAPPTAPPTLPPTTAPPTAPPPTAAPTTAGPTTTPTGGGDLGVPGYAMQRPPCDGGYITILASAIGEQATPDGMRSVLDDFAGSNYLRTDRTCSSLSPSANGQPIYVVYFGPFATDSQACAARSQGPRDAYVKRLSNDLGADHSITCT